MGTQAIAFDLDDTLLRDDRTISDYTVDVLRRAAARGIHIVPASGRARDSMKPFVDQIGCASLFIACNGAEIWRSDGSPVRAMVIPDETAQEILAFSRKHRAYIQSYKGTRFYYTVQNGYDLAYAATSMLTGVHTEDLPGFVRRHPTSKLLLMDDPARVAEMLEESRAQFAGRASVTCSKPFYLEFNPPEATKGQALRACGELLGFPLRDAVAFGDSLNDLSMLETAGTGVAVANAREEVRQRVGCVCAGNQEDGVARWIEAHVLAEDAGC